jgi:hypothetical protein
MEKEPKSKKSLMIFGILIITSALIGVFSYVISLKNPEFHSIAIWAFAVTSAIGVAFQIYMKEFRVGQANWRKIPVAFKFVWWFIFVTNSFNFMNQAITTFIF